MEEKGESQKSLRAKSKIDVKTGRFQSIIKRGITKREREKIRRRT